MAFVNLPDSSTSNNSDRDIDPALKQHSILFPV